MKLGIGTVQFGQKYGISNNLEIPNKKQIKKILYFLYEKNIDYIDTAFLYGLSEKKIGELSPPQNKFKIITKTIKVSGSEVTKSDLINFKDKIQESLEFLKRKRIYALLVHRENDILKPGFEELYNHLLKLKMNGTVKKIGFSSYEPVIAERILKKVNLDIIQIPLNILNQAYLQKNILKVFKKNKIEIHARSVFDQGILAENENALNLDIEEEKKKKIKNLLIVLNQKNYSLFETAIWFIK
ncbi:aldo/keto reductase, partial [Alphaproteobacteria bacterium]|nr:aldo/keto reductase [Alphaproteobacteria bacterium]